MTALDAALLAMAGLDPVPVIRRPRVRIAVTGSEIVAAGDQPGPVSLRDSNGPMLLALCRTRGVPAAAGPRVADEPAAVRRLFEEAGDGADLLLTTGGVSAGDWDLLPAEARAGSTSSSPRRGRNGKPIASRARDTLWFGLPGIRIARSASTFRRGLERREGDSDPASKGLARVTGVDGPPAADRTERAWSFPRAARGGDARSGAATTWLLTRGPTPSFAHRPAPRLVLGGDRRVHVLESARSSKT